MRMTELFAYLNNNMPKGYKSYHLDMSSVRVNKKVKAFRKEIKKQKKEEAKLENKGRKDGTEDIDIFGDE